jgi:hypothetical protein
MLDFAFNTDSDSHAFCEGIAMEMCGMFHVSVEEAVNIINWAWSGHHFERKYEDTRYHWLESEWAKRLYRQYVSPLRAVPRSFWLSLDDARRRRDGERFANRPTLECPHSTERSAPLGFERDLDSGSYAFCEVIAKEMARRYNVPIEEAVTRMNWLWSQHRTAAGRVDIRDLLLNWAQSQRGKDIVPAEEFWLGWADYIYLSFPKTSSGGF